MEEHCRDKAPNLILLRDVVSEFGLERVQSADPALLVSLLVSHDRGVDDLRQDKYADAEKDEGQCDRLKPKVREKSLQTLQALVSSVFTRDSKAIRL